MPAKESRELTSVKNKTNERERRIISTTALDKNCTLSHHALPPTQNLHAAAHAAHHVSRHVATQRPPPTDDTSHFTSAESFNLQLFFSDESKIDTLVISQVKKRCSSPRAVFLLSMFSVVNLSKSCCEGPRAPLVVANARDAERCDHERCKRCVQFRV